MLKKIIYLNFLLCFDFKIFSVENINILDMPNEILLNIFQKLIEDYLDKWQNIFNFDQEFLKEDLYKDILNIRLTSKRFDIFFPDLLKILKRLKKDRFKYLKKLFKKRNILDKEVLNSNLYALLNTYPIQKSNIKKAVELVLLGADVNIKANNGENLLILSSLRGYLDFVDILINLKTDLNSKNINGDTALMWLIFKGNIKILRTLIELGADVNICNNSGDTALMWATVLGDINIVKLLIACGANINFKNIYGNTVLIQAVKLNNVELVRLFLNLSPDIKIKNLNQKDALAIAYQKNYKDIMKLLKKRANSETCLLY